jgi:hypothetical protein
MSKHILIGLATAALVLAGCSRQSTIQPALLSKVLTRTRRPQSARSSCLLATAASVEPAC